MDITRFPISFSKLGVPVRLRELTVSLDDPAGFLDALGVGPR